MAIQLNKTEIIFSKPLNVGMTILDISKTCIHDFHYGIMLKNFPNRSKLLYTNSDSLIYEIKWRYIWVIPKPHIHMFHTYIHYSLDNLYNIPLVFLMKDKAERHIITLNQ